MIDTILIVESDVQSRRLLRNLLKIDSHRIIEAHHPAEALYLARTHSPDLVLMAIPAFTKEVFDTARCFREDTVLKKMPLVALTLCAIKGEEEKAREHGFSGLICKPIDPERFLDTIAGFLPRNRKAAADTGGQPAGDERRGSQNSGDAPTVLLVAGDSEMRQKLVRQIRNRSYDLTAVTTGEETLALAGRRPVDLVILIDPLPGMGSLEVCRRLKRRDQNQNLQLLMMLTLGNAQTLRPGVEVGVDDFIFPPLSTMELQGRIKALLARKARLDCLNPPMEKLLNHAMRDRLTGLYNGTYFRYFLSHEVKRCERRKEPVALIMIYMDGLKDIYTAYGESAGDDVLKAFGQLIQENLREIDLAVGLRRGEFAVVLPTSGPEGVSAVVDRVRQLAAEHTFATGASFFGKKISVTMAAACYPSQAADSQALIQVVNQQLARQQRSRDEGGEPNQKSYPMPEAGSNGK